MYIQQIQPFILMRHIKPKPTTEEQKRIYNNERRSKSVDSIYTMYQKKHKGTPYLSQFIFFFFINIVNFIRYVQKKKNDFSF